MTVKVFESETNNLIYFGETVFTGEFKSVTPSTVTIKTETLGVVVFLLADLEYVEDTNLQNLIAVLSQMKDFNATGKVTIQLLEN